MQVIKEDQPLFFLFLFTAVACGFAAFAYAEFASIVPASGSAYTYSYVAFGEIIAWIIGWALIMEYAIGNVTVAISWSGYFTDMLSHIRISALGIEGIHIPLWAQMDYFSALNGHSDALTLLESGKTLKDLKQFQRGLSGAPTRLIKTVQQSAAFTSFWICLLCSSLSPLPHWFTEASRKAVMHPMRWLSSNSR